MKTEEEIQARKEKLKELYNARRTNGKTKTMLVGAIRELDWVLEGTK